jgi:hypothetical protein
MDFSSQPPSALQQQTTSNAPPSSGYIIAEGFSQNAANESPNHTGEQDTSGSMIFQPRPSRGSSANSILVQHSTFDEERRRLERSFLPDFDRSFHESAGQGSYSAFSVDGPMRPLPSILG